MKTQTNEKHSTKSMDKENEENHNEGKTQYQINGQRKTKKNTKHQIYRDIHLTFLFLIFR